MHQVIQPIHGGATAVVDLAAPALGPTQVLIANHYSVLSAGTERQTVALARRSLWQKARERPDQVRRVVEKIRQEGIGATMRQVNARLSGAMPLGYASAGMVAAVGAEVHDLAVGQRVASNGSHAGFVAVPRPLVAPVPDAVPLDAACYAVLASIGLHGVRLSHAGLGDVVAVIGLGLIGQLAVAMAKASGCVVLAADTNPARTAMAKQLGADWAGSPSGLTEAAAARTQGRGADAVILCAASRDGSPLAAAADCARRKARVVAVGATGLNVPRRDFYFKELELVVSCSYGPGRYDPAYEQAGRDYPAEYVRWTEGRNLSACLDLMAAGKLPASLLTTHRYPIARATDAYDMVAAGKTAFLGIVLEHDAATQTAAPGIDRALRPTTTPVTAPRQTDRQSLGVGMIGAGLFATSTLLPALTEACRKRSRLAPDAVTRRGIASAGGMSAYAAARQHRFAAHGTDPQSVIDDPATDAVFVATRHDQHATLAESILRAGKAAWIEKPLALTMPELDQLAAIRDSLGTAAPPLMVGFNRRFSPAAAAMRAFFQEATGPRSLLVRFNAGPLPADHWLLDPSVGGGRLVGEACHAIDLCRFLAASPITAVTARSGGSILTGATGGIDADLHLSLSHQDGSISTVVYGVTGDRAAGKEWVEVHGGGRSATLDDWRVLRLCQRGRRTTRRWWRQTKGHPEAMAAFLDAVARWRQEGNAPEPIPGDELFNVSQATLMAAAVLNRGHWQPVPGASALPLVSSVA